MRRLMRNWQRWCWQMAKKMPILNLPSADDLFTTQEERDDSQREKVLDIPLSQIDAFPDHPFQVKNDESMQAMIDSVRTVGIQTPAVVRLKNDAGSPCGSRYEMVSGHRRKLACELAGLESLPCIVREMSHDEAVIAMVDSNLQREVILPSEKAWSYRMKLEAMKRQGQRTDLTSNPLGRKSRGVESAKLVGESLGDSQIQVRRYIRLTELVPSLLDMVDENQLAMRPAVELSYLSQEYQHDLLAVMKSKNCSLSHVQAVKMRKFFEENYLSNDVILSIMQEDKPNTSEHFKLPREKIHSFFPANTSAKVIEETIIKALELWQGSNK